MIKELINNNFIKELTVDKPIKELIKELINSLSIEKLIKYIKSVYLNNNLI